MTYAELIELVYSTATGNISFDMEGTGYLFEFQDKSNRDAVAIALTREEVAVERRGDLELFVQL